MTRSTLERDLTAPVTGSEPVQPDLWTLAESGAVDASTMLGPVQEAAPPKRGRGRPPGSKNRTTEDLRAYVLSQHRHPVAVMAEMVSMKPRQLAERLGVVEDGEALTPGQVMGMVDRQIKLLEVLTRVLVPAAAPTAPQAPALAIQLNIGAPADKGVSVPSHAGPDGGEAVGLGAILASWSDADRSDIE